MADSPQALSQTARRIPVVDDEALARQRVVRDVRQFEQARFGQECLIEEAESGIRAVELIHSLHTDAVFIG